MQVEGGRREEGVKSYPFRASLSSASSHLGSCGLVKEVQEIQEVQEVQEADFLNVVFHAKHLSFQLAHINLKLL